VYTVLVKLVDRIMVMCKSIGTEGIADLKFLRHVLVPQKDDLHDLINNMINKFNILVDYNH